MTTLTQTAYYARRAIAIAGISLVGLIFLRASVSATKTIVERLKPPPPEKPTVSFGRLPKLEFPQKEVPELSFRLETIEGTLPVINLETIPVYFMPHQTLGLLSLDRAKEKASLIGFDGDPKTTDNVNYIWSAETEPPTTLEMNINTGNFFLRYYLEQNPNVNFPQGYDNDQNPIMEAKSWLSAIKHNPADLIGGQAELTYYHYIPPNLNPAVSLSEANLVRVNFFRQDINEMRIMPPDPTLTPVSVLLANADNETGSIKKLRNVVEAKYTYYDIDRESFATYPLKLVNQAWNELSEGKGYVAHLGENRGGTIVIRNVYLAYYDSITPQNFLQPIYVFEGDEDFYAYVPAIDPGWQE